MSLRRSLLGAAVLVGAAVALPGNPAAAVPPTVGNPYSLAATVSPPPLTADGCAADPACVTAPAPAGGGADDHAALTAAVATAAGRAVPAVVSGGTVLTPAQPATVRLGSGGYTLSRPLRLPPNVNLRGGGITATTLALAPASWANFGYSYLVAPTADVSAGSTNTVSDLTLNGNCKRGAGAPDPSVLPSTTCDLGAAPNYGGGLDAGDRWTIQQVRFTNLNYFKLWIAGTHDVRAVDNRFDGWGGAGSGGEDNIGGGSHADGTVVEHNQFDATIRGNSLDFTNATRATIRYNTVWATRFYLAYRGVTDYANMYLEAVTDSTVADNVLHGAHLVLQSNAGYSHAGENLHVTNPRGVTVTGNEVHDSFGAGITVKYDDYPQALAAHQTFDAGANVLTGNLVRNPTESGILVFGCQEDAKDLADTVTGNTVVNAGAGGSTAYATGCGTFDTTGIGISHGRGDRVSANTVVDDQAAPTTWYGVHVGARKGNTTPVDTILADNSATGVIGGLYRYAAAAPDPATGLARAGTTLTWAEAYPLAGRPVAGYRVYRGGLLAATLPVGSATIPGNLLGEAAASLETGVAGWTAGAGTAVTANPNGGAVGSASMRLTATAAGQLTAAGPAVPVTPGVSYTSVSSFQAGATGRRVRAGLVWLNAQGGVISRVASGNVATVDASTGWMTSSYPAVAPANAASVQAWVLVDGAAAGESHLVDRIGVVAGSSTEAWTDPAPPAGPVRYQVVAYRAGDGENSAVATLVTP